jgi:hypothetical protein
MTMAYIVVVNPQILSQAGMPAEGVVFATHLVGRRFAVMGLYATTHRDGAWYVAERVLHVLRLPGDGHPGARRSVGVPLWSVVRPADGYAHPRTDRERHPRRPQALDRAGIGMFIAFVDCATQSWWSPIRRRLSALATLLEGGHCCLLWHRPDLILMAAK